MRLGAQSYTIRDFTQNETDFRASMKRLAGIGYTTVQLSAVGPILPEVMREACDEAGLQIVLTHTNPDRMLRETEAVIREHEALGCDYIGIGMMPERYRSAARVSRFVEDYLTPAMKMRDAGKLLMYHHHAMEWEKVTPDRNMLDVLVDGFPEDLMGITLDTYWVQAAGADVCDTILALSHRIPCVHLKDMAVKGFEQRMAAVGEGNLPFPKILDLLGDIGRTEYLLVEQDHCYGEDPFECLRRSYQFLREEGYQ